MGGGGFHLELLQLGGGELFVEARDAEAEPLDGGFCARCNGLQGEARICNLEADLAGSLVDW